MTPADLRKASEGLSMLARVAEAMGHKSAADKWYDLAAQLAAEAEAVES